MRILFVQRSLAPPGGGNGVAAWMVHALAGWADLTTLTLAPWTAADTNSFYGTTIDEALIRQRVVPWPLQHLSRLEGDSLTRLRMAAVLGEARRIANQFDVVISADHFAPLAAPGIQYAYFPQRIDPAPARLAPIVRAYFRLCEWWLGVRWRNAANNLTLVTSHWTAQQLRALGEINDPMVLYPPIVDPGDGLPWAQRDNTFLCVGRFTPAKRIELAMSIVESVRRSCMPDACLAVVGSPVDRAYTDHLRRQANGRPWITFHEDLSRAELAVLMRRSRYGLQPMIGEHFGMATAEMTRAGCVVFAHDSGGTPEILDGASSLLWSTEQDAVARIASIDPAAVQPRLRERARMFLADHFVAEFRAIVTRYVNLRNSGSAINS